MEQRGILNVSFSTLLEQLQFFSHLSLSFRLSYSSVFIHHTFWTLVSMCGGHLPFMPAETGGRKPCGYLSISTLASILPFTLISHISLPLSFTLSFFQLFGNHSNAGSHPSICSVHLDGIVCLFWAAAICACSCMCVFMSVNVCQPYCKRNHTLVQKVVWLHVFLQWVVEISLANKRKVFLDSITRPWQHLHK